MAIYDRHYVRDAPPLRGFEGAGGGGPRAWSVTTWLIIICVGVFLLDNFFLQPRMFPTWRFEPADLARAPLRDLHIVTPPGGPVSLPDVRTVSGRWLLVIERATGNHVGWVEVVQMRYLESFLHFSTGMLLHPSPNSFGLPRLEFWRLIGFQFLHFNSTHLIFNMIGLFFFGPIVEQHLGGKRYLAFYLLCGIFGALLYMLLNLGGLAVAEMAQQQVAIPGLLFNDAFTPLIGASAGVFGVLMAGAYLMPRAQVLLFFFVPMQLRTLAYALVAVALFSIIFGARNAGGEAGHLGGAIAGWYFIRRPHHLHGFFDFLGRVDPTSHHYRDRSQKKGASVLRRQPGLARSEEVDRILAKVSAQGLRSLTEEEKRILSEASKRD